MISVQNRLRLSSGNKFLLFVLLILASCSPRSRPVPEKKPEVVTEKPRQTEPTKAREPFKVALILPFNATKINSKSKADLERAGMAIDFYQGFTLGLDAASLLGRSFTLNVLDSKVGTAQTASLLRQQVVTEADLVVGPIFPENIRQLKALAPSKVFISPLAATLPGDFNNQRLISLTPNIKLHADRMAEYIRKMTRLTNINVVVISAKGFDETFTEAIRTKLQADGKFGFQEFASISELETKVQAGKHYVVVVTTSDKSTVTLTLDRLARIKSRYGNEITVFGHPNWLKQTYNSEKLQALNTIVSTSSHIDYKGQEVIEFMKLYRSKFGFEPDEFAFKGFDTGYYFGKILSRHGKDFMGDLVREHHKGLHNDFQFVNEAGVGIVNQSVHLLQYRNFQLVSIR